jgi:hypothetical protein
LSSPHLQHNVLSNPDRELAHARSAEFLHDPVASGRQVLLLLVYSVDLELHCECEVGAGWWKSGRLSVVDVSGWIYWVFDLLVQLASIECAVWVLYMSVHVRL